MVDEKVLILGSSAIDTAHFKKLAENINTTTLTNKDCLIVPAASNPAHTKDFVNKNKGDLDFEEKLYMRALKCVDNATFVIVDISSASTGMGMEVGYLLSKYPQKLVAFIAQQGTKVSPHIAGLYKHATGKDIEVCFYKDPSEMTQAVKQHSAYNDFYIDLVY